MTNNFLTPAEQLREALYERVCKLYKTYRAVNPTISNNRIFIAIGVDVKRSPCQVRNICVKKGVMTNRQSADNA